eukprot:513360-Alexandrium_andersonii.AAC.1
MTLAAQGQGNKEMDLPPNGRELPLLLPRKHRPDLQRPGAAGGAAVVESCKAGCRKGDSRAAAGPQRAPQQELRPKGE